MLFPRFDVFVFWALTKRQVSIINLIITRIFYLITTDDLKPVFLFSERILSSSITFGCWQTETLSSYLSIIWKMVIILVNVWAVLGITVILREGAAHLYQVLHGQQCILNTNSLWTWLKAKTWGLPGIRGDFCLKMWPDSVTKQGFLPPVGLLNMTFSLLRVIYWSGYASAWIFLLFAR